MPADNRDDFISWYHATQMKTDLLADLCGPTFEVREAFVTSEDVPDLVFFKSAT